MLKPILLCLVLALLSSNVAVRDLIKPQAGGKATKTLHVYIRKVRDAICLTFTDALD